MLLRECMTTHFISLWSSLCELCALQYPRVFTTLRTLMAANVASTAPGASRLKSTILAAKGIADLADISGKSVMCVLEPQSLLH